MSKSLMSFSNLQKLHDLVECFDINMLHAYYRAVKGVGKKFFALYRVRGALQVNNCGQGDFFWEPIRCAIASVIHRHCAIVIV